MEHVLNGEVLRKIGEGQTVSETDEISRRYNAERGLGECVTHKSLIARGV